MESTKKGHWTIPSLTIPPTSTVHKSTFIILHGRGSTAEKFAPPFLAHSVSRALRNHEAEVEEGEEQRSFQSHLPNTKFIFPTARLLRARAYNRSLTHQWFDLYPLDLYSSDHKSHVQSAGLRDSVRYVHELLRDAVREVGGKNVVLMGLSQGCATALVSSLLWSGEPLAAVVGMCGWLPFAKGMGEAISIDEEGGEETDDVFERGPEETDKSSTAAIDIVVEYLLDELELAEDNAYKDPGNKGMKRGCPSLSTPIFLGHGTEDEKVPIEDGRHASTLLKRVDINVELREYEGLGHWYSADMLRDIFAFLQDHRFEV